ncbi:hypothetical protein TNCV_4649221 [Trichonephila clavipes]|uniref:Uncharacterized protein n=1 Tax=Trichonephila clavipes TaxID=2585209 RepID=A0A8X6SXG3_TRICX|nr:hypothetical protein TNCV_4649221 [Trichonephila clavipes]
MCFYLVEQPFNGRDNSEKNSALLLREVSLSPSNKNRLSRHGPLPWRRSLRENASFDGLCVPELEVKDESPFR